MTQQGQTPMVTGSPPKAKEEAIARLLERTGYAITSENGQRKYAPQDGDLPLPPRGSEVFVGKLPRDVFEDELVPLFEGAGAIREMRLMMEQGSCNRGFAFVMYTSPEEAKRAIEELDNHEMRKGRFLGVCKSVDNCRLFVGGIPKSKTREEILEEIKKVTDQVTRVILYSSIQDKARNRGFAFVEYESHRAAAMARRKLIPGKIPLFGHDIAVDWAEPEPDVDEDTMAKVTVLYARNLMLSTSEERIREVFSLEGAVVVEKVKKLRDFAFVHYSSRDDAQAALDRLDNVDLDGSIVEVTWAKPPDRVQRQRCGHHPRAGQQMSPPPFIYAPPPAFDSYAPPPPFANCAGRGGFMHRVAPFRGRGRGAAGVRRFRSFGPPPHHPGPFKAPEMHAPHYAQYGIPPNGKREKGEQYGHEYVLMPVPPSAEGTPIMPHGPHPRVAHPGYLYPPPGYEDVPYFTYIATAPVSSY